MCTDAANETMEAFLDLKSTPEPSSDSSEFSDSLQSESKVCNYIILASL